MGRAWTKTVPLYVEYVLIGAAVYTMIGLLRVYMCLEDAWAAVVKKPIVGSGEVSNGRK